MKTHFPSLFLFLSYTFFINIISFANGYKYINDSIQKTDTIIKQNNNTLLAKITYEAIDTTSISPKDKLIRLYNNAKITYQGTFKRTSDLLDSSVSYTSVENTYSNDIAGLD